MQAMLHHPMNPVGDLTIEQFIVPDINFDSNSKGLIQSVLIFSGTDKELKSSNWLILLAL